MDWSAHRIERTIETLAHIALILVWIAKRLK